MRTRTRDLVLQSKSIGASGGTSRIVSCDNSSVVGTDNFPGYTNLPVHSTIELMADELGQGKTHNCWHRKMTELVNINTAPYIVSHNAGSGGHIEYTGWDHYWTQLHANVLADGYDEWGINYGSTDAPYRWTIGSSSIDETVLREDCFEKAKGLKADVLLNVIEANQFIPSVRSLASCLPELRDNWGQIRKMVRTASGSFLAWKFGVSPVLSDVMSILRYGPRLADDIKKRQSMTPSRFSSVLELPVSFNGIPREFFGLAGRKFAEYTNVGVITKHPSIRYVLVVKPRVKYLTPLFNGMSVLAQRFASSPASLAWERIPFSFVVDWFVDIRSVLRTLDKMVLEPPYEVVSFTRSMSYQLRTDVGIAWYKTCASNTEVSRQSSGSVEYKHYERSLVSDNKISVIWKPRFGKNQAAITAALISQMLSKL